MEKELEINEPDTERKISREELLTLVAEAEQIKRQFRNCDNYKKEKDILKDARRSVDYYEGRQWNDYKGRVSFEKPTLNFIQNMTDGKESSILQKTYKPIFVIDDDQASSDKVTKFSEWQMKEMGQDDLNRRMVHDGLLKGTYIVYFYWDEDAVGSAGITDGALQAVTVDIDDFAVANPRETDVQKQEYIIIRSRESVASIKKQCDFLSEKEKEMYITATHYNSIYSNDVEQTGEALTDVYLKFFRQNGEVYFEKATEQIVFQKATSINPLTNFEAMENSKPEFDLPESEEGNPKDNLYKYDPVNREMMTINKTEYTQEEQFEHKFMARQYPVIVDSFIQRNNCIFGVSFVSQLIALQKITNQLVTTQVISAAKQTLPTIVVKEGALGTSSIDSTKAGGILVDHSPVGVDGIKVLNTGSMPTSHYELAQSLISLTKDVWRASDVLDDGRNIPSGMSGYAINQLLQVQDKPIAQWQQVMSRTIAKEGKILEMFYKLYYRNKRYSVSLSDAELISRNQGKDLSELSHSTTDIFNGNEYLDTPFNVTVEVCESAKYSEVMLTSTLETLFLNGTIEKISPEYLMIWAELVPDYVFPKKNEFRMLLQQKINGVISQLEAQVQQDQQQLQYFQAVIQQASAQNTALQNEFKNTTEIYNAKIKEAQNQVKMAGESMERQHKRESATTSQRNEKVS